MGKSATVQKASRRRMGEANDASSSGNANGNEVKQKKKLPPSKSVRNTPQDEWQCIASTAVMSTIVIALSVTLAIALAIFLGRSDTGGAPAAGEILAQAGRPLDSRQLRQFPCAQAYTDELRRIRPACLPAACGRFVDDSLVTADEAAGLLALARRGLRLGGGSGGASILDLHSGALSRGDKFVNVYALPGVDGGGGRAFTPTMEERRLYAEIVERIRAAVAAAFRVPDSAALRLTRPTFFSRLTAAEARTPHDEYWHAHVDKETYGSFHFTSLLYLVDYGVSFRGGRFAFVNATVAGSAGEQPVFVEPRTGRVSAFTSGAENTHRVERVTDGERFALTIAFSCNPAAAIDPAQMGPPVEAAAAGDDA